jgi:hypothetical protein
MKRSRIEETTDPGRVAILLCPSISVILKERGYNFDLLIHKFARNKVPRCMMSSVTAIDIEDQR